MATDCKACIERTRAMLVQANRVPRRCRLEKGIVLPFLENGPLQEWQLLVQHPLISRGFDIMCGDIGKPRLVVGYPGADTLAGFRQPPVLDVAFWKLPPCRAQQMLAYQSRLCGTERNCILQLVTESVCPRCLIEARASPDAARKRLI